MSDETKITLSIASDVTGGTENLEKEKNTILNEQESEENKVKETKQEKLSVSEQDFLIKIEPLEQMKFPLGTDQKNVIINKLNLKDQDNVSSVISVHKEDSILQEAKNNINSPTPSDVEGTSPGTMSKFFKSEMAIAMPDQKAFKDLAKEHLDNGNRFRLKANQLFKKNKFKDALGEYLNAVEELNFLIRLQNESLNMTNINWVRMECLNSIAVCYLLLKEYQKVLDYTAEVLRINSNNYIALSYRAKALIAIKNYKDAQEIIKIALSVKYSKSLISLLKEIDEKLYPIQKNTKPNSINTETLSNEDAVNILVEMKNELNQKSNTLSPSSPQSLSPKKQIIDEKDTFNQKKNNESKSR